MQVKIERGNDVNAFLFDAMGAVVYGTLWTIGGPSNVPRASQHTIDSAYEALTKCFEGSQLYRFYKGKSHIAVHSQNHEKRIAVISQ